SPFAVGSPPGPSASVASASPSRYSWGASASSFDGPEPGVKTGLCSSSVEITQTDGSSTDGPGSASPSVQSPSDSCPAGVWLNETYVLSGACLNRVAVLIAVMICRVTHNSAKLRNEDLSGLKSRTAL